MSESCNQLRIDVKSKIPYLIDAIRFWSMDSGMTPQLLINADSPEISLPLEQIQTHDGEVVLNVHDQAVDGFSYEDEFVVFKTRFSGRSFDVAIPFNAVIAIFTRETHEGLHLLALSQAEVSSEVDEGEEPAAKPTSPPGKPHLTLVK